MAFENTRSQNAEQGTTEEVIYFKSYPTSLKQPCFKDLNLERKAIGLSISEGQTIIALLPHYTEKIWLNHRDANVDVIIRMKIIFVENAHCMLVNVV